MSVLEKTRIPNVFTSLLLTFSGAKGSPFRLARLQILRSKATFPWESTFIQVGLRLELREKLHNYLNSLVMHSMYTSYRVVHFEAYDTKLQLLDPSKRSPSSHLLNHQPIYYGNGDSCLELLSPFLHLFRPTQAEAMEQLRCRSSDRAGSSGSQISGVGPMRLSQQYETKSNSPTKVIYVHRRLQSSFVLTIFSPGKSCDQGFSSLEIPICPAELMGQFEQPKKKQTRHFILVLTRSRSPRR